MDIALHASDVLLAATIEETAAWDESQFDQDCDSFAPPPLMHFPHCRLEISEVEYPATSSSAGEINATTTTCKLEQIALPGPLVRTLLSRFEGAPPQQHQQQQYERQGRGITPSTSSLTPASSTETRPKQQQQQQQQQQKHERPTPKPVQIQPHFDDKDDWVFSRCLLADFTGFRDDEAEALSSQGRLCCWASVVLQPPPQGAGDKWELGFIVQRVGLGDPKSGWCECF